MSPPAPHPVSWRAIIAVWCCVGLLLVVQMAADINMPPFTRPWAWGLAQQVLRAIYWAALTPFIMRLGASLPLSGSRRYAHLLLHAAFAVGLSLLFLGARIPVMFWLYQVPTGQRNLDFVLARLTARNVIDPMLYFGVIATDYLLGMVRNLQHREVEEARLRQQLAESQLNALRQQVQPHFLFNALNAIATLVRGGRSTEAVRMLGQLGGLHRRIVEAGVQLHGPLEGEFALLQDYLGIERTRFGDRLVTELSLPDSCRQAVVPSLLLQPLAENAIKHGVARHAAGGNVRVAARRDGARLIIEVSNPLAAGVREVPAGTGAGLRLTRQRLEQRYGAGATLRASEAGGEFVARIELPFQTEEHAT